jgi:hypothetical protein
MLAATLLYLKVVSSIFSPRLLNVVMRRGKLNTGGGLELRSLGRLGDGRILQKEELAWNSVHRHTFVLAVLNLRVLLPAI